MKAIIMGGGLGSRLRPMTYAVTKHLQAVYDKPMIYYPLALLIEAGIRSILLVTHPEDSAAYQRLLGDGSQFGIHIAYHIQYKPESLGLNLLACKNYINDDPFVLAFGDNFFSKNPLMIDALDLDKAGVFVYRTKSVCDFGVLVQDDQNRPVRIDEKPIAQREGDVITGLYYFPGDLIEQLQQQEHALDEVMVTELKMTYLQQNRLGVYRVAQESQWFDLGTIERLAQASCYVEQAQVAQACVLGSPEWAAWQRGYINEKALLCLLEPMRCSAYGQQLIDLLSSSQ